MREGEYSRARPTSRRSGPECKGGDRCGDMRIVHPPAARARRCALVLPEYSHTRLLATAHVHQVVARQFIKRRGPVQRSSGA